MAPGRELDEICTKPEALKGPFAAWRPGSDEGVIGWMEDVH